MRRVYRKPSNQSIWGLLTTLNFLGGGIRRGEVLFEDLQCSCCSKGILHNAVPKKHFRLLLSINTVIRMGWGGVKWVTFSLYLKLALN